jgi:hypothetical protein
MTPAVSDDDIEKAVAAYRVHPSNKAQAARDAGFSATTFKRHLKTASERGMFLDHDPAMPGFRISQVTNGPNGKSIQQKREHGEAFAVPEGHVVKGVSALVDEEGREVVKWIKTTVGTDAVDVIEACKTAFEGITPAKPTKSPNMPGASDFCSLTPCNDWHVNMFAWGKETPIPGENKNWDLKIAERVIGDAVCAVVERSRPSRLAIVLGGGDLTHADNKEGKTAKSGNILDCDGRYQKSVQVACRLKVLTIDAHLEKHNEVLVRIIPGNHDEHTAVAIAYYLHAYYRNEPRVTVDLDPSLFWWHRFGKVMLGATHGHTVKLQDMPMVMANRRPEDWGATRHRYIHGFHIHHKTLYGFESDGCFMESHQAPIPSDGWHYSKGYITGQSIQSIPYHCEVGEYGRVREPIIVLPKAANDNVLDPNRWQAAA